MRRPGEGPAAIDGYASADAVAWGHSSVLFHVRGVRGRDVALKVFRLGAERQRVLPRNQMLGDWRVWRGLAHPHVLPVSDFGERNDSLYVATPWVDGPSLRAVLDRHRTLEPRQIRELARQLGSALDAAAAVRLIHLDVKPENVLFAAADRTVHAYVRDFGAGSFATSARGAFEYAAPEQIAGGALDGRAMVYSLGCLLYETLTGATPYAGRSRDGRLEEPPPVVEGGPGEVDRVFARALATRRDQRYATCTELAEALCAALALAPTARPAEGAPRRRFGVRQLTVAASVALALSAIATTVSWVTAGASGESAPPDKPLSSRQFYALIREGGSTVKRARKPVRVEHVEHVSTPTAAAARPERHVVSQARVADTPASVSASNVARPAPVVAARPSSISSTPVTTTPAAAPAPAAAPPPPPPPATDPTTPPLPPPPP